jgi:hypothetical protein
LKLAAVTAVFAALGALPAECQQSKLPPPPPWGQGIIVLTEIEQVGRAAVPGQAAQVKLRVTRVIRDAFNLGLQPGEYEGPYVWEGVDLAAGQRYLVYSNQKQGLDETFRSLYNLWPLSGQDHSVEDLDLILQLVRLPTAQPSSRLAAEISSPAWPHGHLVALYAGSLLADSRYADTVGLAFALQHSPDAAFSDGGKESLFGACDRQVGIHHRDIPENLLSVFVTVTARYFLAEAEPPESGPTRVQSDVLAQAHAIAETEPVAAAFRSLRPASTVTQLHQKLSQLASDGRLEPEKRAQARQLLFLLQPE